MTNENHNAFDPAAWLSIAETLGFTVLLIDGDLALGYPMADSEMENRVEQEGRDNKHCLIVYLKTLIAAGHAHYEYASSSLAPVYGMAS